MVIVKVTNFTINTIKNTINNKKPDAKRTSLTKFDPLPLRDTLSKLLTYSVIIKQNQLVEPVLILTI